MPAFHLSKAQQEALSQFFKELDKTGISQPKAGEPKNPWDLWGELVEKQISQSSTSSLSPKQAAGRDIVQKERCIDCHLPNPLSANEAPDLTMLTEALEKQELLQVLTQGRPTKGMPMFNFSEDDKTAVIAFLKWLNENRDGIVSGFETLENANTPGLKIPWFEYK